MSYSVRRNSNSPSSLRRPRGAEVAVERHPDAAGVDQVGAVRAGPAELQVAVAEDDRPVVDVEQIRSSSSGWGSGAKLSSSESGEPCT